ncbi:MAG: GspH/FimT family pseudopilin, partial [Rubrivivax sp.]
TNRTSRGFSLIESMTVMAVAGTLLGSAAPGFMALQDGKRLQGAAALVETELQYARSLAVERREAVRFTFGVGTGSGCYVIHTGSPGSCRCSAPDQPAVCTGNGAAVRTVVFTPADRLSIRTASSTFGFDPGTGTVTPTATLKLSNPNAQTLHVVVNIMGRVRACSPNGVPGYRAC